MLPSTVERVPAHTSDAINRRIQQETAARVAYHARNPAEIDERLGELEREWDIERTLEANAATLAFTGVLLSAARGRTWLVLPALVTGFLLQHALQGWCPPIPVLRRLGFRTATEIEQERQALKALRGDYSGVAEAQNKAVAALAAART